MCGPRRNAHLAELRVAVDREAVALLLGSVELANRDRGEGCNPVLLLGVRGSGGGVAGWRVLRASWGREPVNVRILPNTERPMPSKHGRKRSAARALPRSAKGTTVGRASELPRRSGLRPHWNGVGHPPSCRRPGTPASPVMLRQSPLRWRGRCDITVTRGGGRYQDEASVREVKEEHPES